MTQKQGQHKKKQRQIERVEAAKQRQRIRFMMAFTIIALIIIGGGFGIYYAAGGGQTSEPVEFAYNTQPMMGDPDAPVKIVEFGDFKCPVCQEFDENFLPQLKKDYIETGKAAYYFINYPIFGEGSMRAALAAESVYHRWPDLYWQYHEAIYDNQGGENEQWATADFLTSVAIIQARGVNADKLNKDIRKQTYLDEVKSDRQKALDLGLIGTPSVFVNGKPVEEISYANLTEAIDQAYEKATSSSVDKG
ncbi:MAG TPA: thioredoxin domain-containing protein [Bacillales bacterium]|nr:thioredoxin domain-containing protein [Bacillales bacterium]